MCNNNAILVIFRVRVISCARARDDPTHGDYCDKMLTPSESAESLVCKQIHRLRPCCCCWEREDVLGRISSVGLWRGKYTMLMIMMMMECQLFATITQLEHFPVHYTSSYGIHSVAPSRTNTRLGRWRRDQRLRFIACIKYCRWKKLTFNWK